MMINVQWRREWFRVAVAVCLATGILTLLIGTIAGASPSAAAAPSQPAAAIEVITVPLPTDVPTQSYPVALTVQPQTGNVYVADTGGRSVVVISYTAVITSIPLGPSITQHCPLDRVSANTFCLTAIEAHPTNGYTYVSQWQTDRFFVISDTESVNQFVGPLRWNGPVAIVANPHTPAAYASGVAGTPDRIGVICDQSPVTELSVSNQEPAALAVATDAEPGVDYIYAAMRNDNIVLIVADAGVCTAEEPALQIHDTVEVGEGPTAVAVHPQTGLVYAASGTEGSVSVISGTTALITTSIGAGGWPPLGPHTFDGYVQSGSTDIIAFGPDNGYAYVSNWVSNTVTVIDHTEVVTTITVGENPNTTIANPRNGWIYVANTADNTVSVISDTEVLTTANVAAYPVDMVAHPTTGYVYVAGRDGEAVSVIRQQPAADFIASRTDGVTPLAITFTNRSIGRFNTWFWEFGDGMSSTLPDPTHVYPAAGAYTITLTASGPDGLRTITKPNYIIVYDRAVAAFSASPTSGSVPLRVQFTDHSVGDFHIWIWNFGDGSGGTTQNPVYTYQTPGVYSVTLTVSGLGGTDSETKASYIHVTGDIFIPFVRKP